LPEVRFEGSDACAALQSHVQDQRRPVDSGDDSGLVYMRPETAQGIFVNFGNVLDTMRRKLPFGIAQVGKAFRNEITPGNFTFRTREFEQMEIEYFVRPGEDEAAHEAWIAERTELVPEARHAQGELARARAGKARACPLRQALRGSRIPLPHGLERARGYRQPHRFRSESPQPFAENPDAVGELKYFDQEQKKHLVPYVIEPSAGADRATLAFLCDAYEDALVKEPPAEETTKLRELVESFAKSVGRREGMAADVKQRLVTTAETIAAGLPGTLPQLIGLMEDSDAATIEVMKKVRGVGEKIAEEHTRTVLHLHPRLAPLTVAVFPLKRNDARLVEMARGLKRDLQTQRRTRGLRRHRRHRQTVPAAGRNRDTVVHHRGFPEPGRPDRHRARPGQHAAGAAEGSRAWANIRRPADLICKSTKSHVLEHRRGFQSPSLPDRNPHRCQPRRRLEAKP
jgi:glycyl-tRNA synthetase